MRRHDKKRNMINANLMMEQRRLEEIEHTPQEARQMEDKYNQILNAKAESIVGINYNGDKFEIKPKVRVWMGNEGLNRGYLSYSLSFKENHEGDYSPELVQINVYDGGGNISAWKESSVSLEDDSIHKIYRMVMDASDYLGGVEKNKLQQVLTNKLKSNRSGVQEEEDFWTKDYNVVNDYNGSDKEINPRDEGAGAFSEVIENYYKQHGEITKEALGQLYNEFIAGVEETNKTYYMTEFGHEDGLNETEETSKYTTLLDMYKNGSRDDRERIKPQLIKAAQALGIELDLR